MSYGSSIILFSLSTPSYTDLKVRKVARGFALPFQILQLLSRRSYRMATPTLIGCETILLQGCGAGASLQGHDARSTARERRGECLASNAVYVDACVSGTTRTHTNTRLR